MKVLTYSLYIGDWMTNSAFGTIFSLKVTGTLGNWPLIKLLFAAPFRLPLIHGSWTTRSAEVSRSCPEQPKSRGLTLRRQQIPLAKAANTRHLSRDQTSCSSARSLNCPSYAERKERQLCLQGGEILKASWPSIFWKLSKRKLILYLQTRIIPTCQPNTNAPLTAWSSTSASPPTNFLHSQPTSPGNKTTCSKTCQQNTSKVLKPTKNKVSLLAS